MKTIMGEIRELPEQDQSMILASLKAQIEVVKKRGALMSMVQGKNHKALG